MMLMKLKGRIEENLITDQIERAKIALCLKRHAEAHPEVKSSVWFAKAIALAERNNGYWHEVQDSVASSELEAYLLREGR